MRKIIVLFAVIAVVMTAFSSCSSEPPALEDVRDELAVLIEGSYEINDIFFGEGLDTYERGGEFDREYHVYSEDDYEYASYEYVTEDCGYLFTESIKSEAEKVYTLDYLDGVYTMAFDGYADETTGAIATARYLDANGWMMKYSYGEKDPFNILPGKRVYDLETMKIVKPSTDKYLNVEVSSNLEGESEKLNVTLRFKLTENGWRLDSPTY